MRDDDLREAVESFFGEEDVPVEVVALFVWSLAIACCVIFGLLSLIISTAALG